MVSLKAVFKAYSGHWQRDPLFEVQSIYKALMSETDCCNKVPPPTRQGPQGKKLIKPLCFFINMFLCVVCSRFEDMTCPVG